MLYEATYEAGSEASVFGGSNALGTITVLDGVSDGAVGTIAFWARYTSTTRATFFTTSGGEVLFEVDTNTALRVVLKDAGDAEKINMPLVGRQLTTDQQWHHYMAAWDTSDDTKSRIYYDNGSGLSPIDTTVVAGNIDYTPLSYQFARGLNGNSSLNVLVGDISEFYFNPAEYLDLGVAANRAKFITPELQPVYMGANGHLPTGTAPAIFMPRPFKNENKGSGGPSVGWYQTGILHRVQGPGPKIIVPSGRGGK